ncbi:MAG: 4-alpha-glucanotransferase [Candidatus Omnitrophica bacterium]|nr:4-alpha-glucanotransferase [Candidatus Omnitrophota bacterium]
MQFSRSSGILLHPTSLPGRFGIGDMGEGAYRFIDFLFKSRQRLWQVLPLSPTGYGNSPYNCFSAFAGNPLLISLEELVKDGLLQQADLTTVPAFPENYVDYPAVIEYKMAMLHRSFEWFKSHGQEGNSDFEGFCIENSSWLDDYSLFMALKDAYCGLSWNKWDKGMSQRETKAIKEASHRLSDPVLFHKYLQYIFVKQWLRLRQYAHDRHIKIIGDIPIFVAYNSLDVWSHPELFQLDDKGRPIVVAGVPPDYFSQTGQLWGNPLYRWDVMAEDGYDWWVKRFQMLLRMVDIIRLDHFRGFEAYWEVSAKEKTAINGHWVKGPGADLFNIINQSLGKLPLIAEDLGVITPEVEALRDQFAFPGMKILHFAFGSGSDNPYLPHNYPKNSVVYTGTHDNDTTNSWLIRTSTKTEREHVLKYLGKTDEIHWEIIRLALSSVADTAIIPLQDVLGLGSEARMNLPGKVLAKNWAWRYTQGMLNDECQERLRGLTELYGRFGVR